jgi:two-component system response regulator YesN
LLEGLNLLIEKIREFWRIRMTIGIGTLYQDLSTEGLKTYAEALIAVQSRFYYGSGKVYPYRDAFNPILPEQFTAFMNNHSALLEKPLKEADLHTTQEVLRRFCDDILIMGTLSPQDTKTTFTKFLLDQFTWLHSVFEEDWQPDIISSLSHAEDLTELKVRTEAWLVKIVQRLEKKKKHKLEPVMQACRTYIMEHYSDDLSLDAVAKQFHFNSSYFSEQFKQYVGINFSDYLLQVRMDSAKRMLETTNEKVYQIACDVGYKDAKYFNRLFKRDTGITPEQYRQIRQTRTDGLS